MSAQTNPRSLRILIVEDERDVLDMLEEVLTGEGHTVITALDGKAGLDCFQRQPVDIVLTDLNMPGISGLEMASRIKKINPSVPVMLLTGWDVGLDTAELAAKGIDCFIKKPFTIADILLALDDLCGAGQKAVEAP
jgi:two-component system response regulator FlrC